MPTTTRLDWRAVAARQDGVLARQQALAAGLTDDAWQWRLTTGTWQALLPGVAVTHSGPTTVRQRAWAAVLAAGAGAALSGDAGLRALGLRLPEPRAVDVAVPERRVLRLRRLPDAHGGTPVVVRRVRGLAAWTAPRRGVPTLRPAPAVLHAAAWAPTDRAAEWRIAAAVQQRLVTPASLDSVLPSMPKLRRRALVRAVLDDVRLGAHAGSELDLLAFLRRNGLPLPDRLQRPVRAGGLRYLDAWWERQRVAAEVDGSHHRDVESWDADVLRANDVVVSQRADRVVLLRLTTGNLRHDEPRLAAQFRAVLL